MSTVHVLDYVAGNIKSLLNAIERAGHHVEFVESPEDITRAQVAITTT